MGVDYITIIEVCSIFESIFFSCEKSVAFCMKNSHESRLFFMINYTVVEVGRY